MGPMIFLFAGRRASRVVCFCKHKEGILYYQDKMLLMMMRALKIPMRFFLTLMEIATWIFTLLVAAMHLQKMIDCCRTGFILTKMEALQRIKMHCHGKLLLVHVFVQ